MPEPNELIERDAIEWWAPSTFRSHDIRSREDVQAAALSLAGEVLTTLHDVLKNPKNDARDRISAATHILDRALGKPQQQVEVTATYTPPELMGDELMDMLAAAQDRLEQKKNTIDI